ncbi:c-type cytochrome [Phenylobacterium soli]|uniref:Cytochrome c n=1 Tax=Phenylobacterium soli TaxID=2170551 RepID=A0A328AHV9_9CAUL|nr:cytochrome c [Phenylobacterium soli]RAK54131.1 cytochrome c [Phenylobacterium soli]
MSREPLSREPFDLRRHLPSTAFVILIVLVVGGFIGAFVFTGAYNIGADAPHTKPVYWAMQTLRDRSIAVRARAIALPRDLNDPGRIGKGAGLYAEMCSGCHLAPGMERTEISQGLYPAAPELSGRLPRAPQQQFWIIKHGVKMTAMPAWGRTHSDDLIWDMVAFVRTLPSLSPAQYQAAVKSAPEDHDTMMRDMPGMAMPEDHSAHAH